jgi:tripartite-type tricarboxylate transporter receptor subunit TctC
MNFRLCISMLLSGAICSLGLQTAYAQEFPTRPLRLVVATTPGQTPDTLARTMALELPKFLGQPVLVENKPGAASLIGYEYVAKQVPADGYTFGIVLVPDLATMPFTVKELRFDPLKDLRPFIGLVEVRLAFGSSTTLPWKSLAELAAYGKANPGKLNYGASLASIRLLTEAVIRDLGMNVVHVPYTAGGPYLQALLAAEIQMGFIAEAPAMSLAEKFRTLAVTGEQRAPGLPAVPTFAELGYPRIRGVSYSLNVPAATPRPIIDRLHAAASRALQEPTARAQFEKMRLSVVGGTPESASARLAEEAKTFAEVARQVGIQPQ